ncbi:hypothetical protein AAZX31_11G191400 [Glycine max]
MADGGKYANKLVGPTCYCEQRIKELHSYKARKKVDSSKIV